MPKYQLNIAGENFLMRFHPTRRPVKYGFYTKFFVEAATPDEAEEMVVGLLRADQSINEFVCNAPDDRASYKVEKMYEIAEWPDCARPRIGLVWFPEHTRKAASKRDEPLT